MEKRPLSPKKKKIWFIIGMVFLLILFLYCSAYFTDSEKSVGEELNGGLEKRLEEALTKMRGVGDVRVVISYASTAESVPASTAAETDMFSREPLIVKQNMPAVRGVLVVAEGAEDIRIRTELMYAVTALLDVDPDQVEILY